MSRTLSRITVSTVSASLILGLGISLSVPASAGSICQDGTYTDSEGRGTCSGHGGVKKSGVTGPEGGSSSSGNTSSGSKTTPPTSTDYHVISPGKPLSVKAGKKVSTLKLLNSLTVADEQTNGYSRDSFKHWTTEDGCDTREWVFIRQTSTGKREGCKIIGGKWYSPYDGKTTTNPSEFDVDHMVPLSEAYGSGAFSWSPDQRMYYANDLEYKPALIAVSASSNRSKADKDPSEWMPPLKSDWCTYLKDWVGVKYRWQLSVDPEEKAAIKKNFAGCSTKQKAPVIAPVAN